MMVDEADIDLVGGSSPHRSGSKRNAGEPLSPRPPNKRKPGPIPRDVLVRRPAPSPSPPPRLSPPPLSPAVSNGDVGKYYMLHTSVGWIQVSICLYRSSICKLCQHLMKYIFNKYFNSS